MCVWVLRVYNQVNARASVHRKVISTIQNILDKLWTSQSIRSNCGWIQIISTPLSHAYSWVWERNRHMWPSHEQNENLGNSTFAQNIQSEADYYRIAFYHLLDEHQLTHIYLFIYWCNKYSPWWLRRFLSVSHVEPLFCLLLWPMFDYYIIQSFKLYSVQTMGGIRNSQSSNNNKKSLKPHTFIKMVSAKNGNDLFPNGTKNAIGLKNSTFSCIVDGQ